ncbi:MAG: TonB-dependent receptor [Flavobacteriales bacterium]|jgi:iron complex outermembrane receptor protein
MRFLISFIAVLSTQVLFSQAKFSGVVRDGYSGETLIGATVFYAEGKGAVTDLDGNFSLSLAPGNYTITVKYVGFADYSKEIQLTSKGLFLEVKMESADLKEVEIIADIAVDRKTPVAFSDISALKIREELGTQDLPLVLNTTPGVYATQSGGGDGDARVNIRGFNQRNVSVMVDGIPMNDMENGWVYWSNWFGLDNVTQKVQVQRGLGASKLAVPAIGGSINILSQGIEQKRQFTVSSELGNNRNIRNSIGFNSGKLKGGWGVTGAFSYRMNDGWVDELGSEQYFYFLKIQKEFKHHSFSLSTMGSPQQHFQRIGRQLMQTYDLDYAQELGQTSTPIAGQIVDMGLRYNSEWGFLRRDRGNPNAPTEVFNSRLNYYHKPIGNFKHFWTPNEKFALSNIVYFSFGDGGGTRLNNSQIDPETGQLDIQFMYDRNTKPVQSVPFLPPVFPYDLNVVNDVNQYKATYYLQSSINSHRWYGLLSTFKYKLNESIEFSGGIDGRYYTVQRYQEIYDLLGADYVHIPSIQSRDANNPSQVVFREGDKINYNVSSVVINYGTFFLAEMEKEKWTGFINVTASRNEFNRVNLFGLKDEQGNHPESGWQSFLGYTAKTGAKYKFNKRHSFFANAGFLNRAQLIQNVYNGNTISVNRDIENEEITSGEVGYVLSQKGLRVTVNGYYTLWNNRPTTVPVTVGTETVLAFVPGMRARHSGIEFESEYQVDDKLTVEGVISLGDWTWQSENRAVILDEIGNPIGEVSFDARGVKVGDAAQTQLSAGCRYEPIKGFYIRPRITYFTDNFSDFNPETLRGDNAGRQSWEMPSYYTLDLNLGYSAKIFKDYKLGFRVNLINITDQRFVTDATNGSTFDINTAEVFFGMGFRWNVGLNFTF